MSPEQCRQPPKTGRGWSPRPGVPTTEQPPGPDHKVCLKCGLVYPRHQLLRYRFIPPNLHREITRYVCPDCVSMMSPEDRLQVEASQRRKLNRGAAAVVNPAAMQGRDRIRKTKGRGAPAILAVHHEVLKDDPNRLSTAFILALARQPKGDETHG
jgi:hypothetical protein